MRSWKPLCGMKSRNATLQCHNPPQAAADSPFLPVARDPTAETEHSMFRDISRSITQPTVEFPIEQVFGLTFASRRIPPQASRSFHRQLSVCYTNEQNR